jgi:hypothetical protein
LPCPYISVGSGSRFLHERALKRHFPAVRGTAELALSNRKQLNRDVVAGLLHALGLRFVVGVGAGGSVTEAVRTLDISAIRDVSFDCRTKTNVDIQPFQRLFERCTFTTHR